MNVQATPVRPRGSHPLAMCVRPSLLFLLAACTASGDEVRPEVDQFVFPTGAAVSPDQAHLFVANANSELRFDSGSIVALDLARVDATVAAWVSAGTVPPGCAPDPNQLLTLACDEAAFVVADAGVRIGNFATSLAAQDKGDGTARLHAAVRGDPSVTWVDWDGARLSCDGGAEGFALCDDAHRLTELDVGVPPAEGEDPPALAPEPFGVYVNSVAGFAMVSHLTTGTITLVDTPADGAPRLVDAVEDLFATSGGIVGAAGLAGRAPTSPNDVVYATSITEDRVQLLTVVRDRNAPAPYLVPSGHFFLDAVGASSGGSDDSRAVAFDAAGETLFVLNREPPSLQLYDARPGATGVPSHQAIAAIDLCREAASLAVVDVGDGDRAMVSCFRDGEVHVVDPRGGGRLEAQITVGRGPYALVPSAARRKLYVTNFLEDTVAVIELDPTSPRRYQVVLRLGEVRS